MTPFAAMLAKETILPSTKRMPIYNVENGIFAGQGALPDLQDYTVVQ